MVLLNCVIWGSKKFIKEHEVRGLLSSLGVKTRLSKISFVGHILF